MIAQKLTIVPQGIVQECNFQYSADPATGLAQWMVHAVLGWFGFTQSYDKSGTFQLDPKTFLSAEWKEGMKIDIGPFSLVVDSIKPPYSTTQLASCSVTIVSDSGDVSVNEAGTILVDLSAEYISIKSVALAGKVASFEIDVKTADAADLKPKVLKKSKKEIL